MRAALALQGADLVTFLALLVLVGPAAERNPLVAAALAAGLLWAVLAAKVALIVVLAAWSRAVGRLERPVWATGAAVGLLGALTNVRAVVG